MYAAETRQSCFRQSSHMHVRLHHLICGPTLIVAVLMLTAEHMLATGSLRQLLPARKPAQRTSHATPHSTLLRLHFIGGCRLTWFFVKTLVWLSAARDGVAPVAQRSRRLRAGVLGVVPGSHFFRLPLAACAHVPSDLAGASPEILSM